ncbi:MAG: prepilin peptidase [Marmoricola sp.]
MIPVALSATLIGVLGLAIGSFINVVIHRFPAGESIVRPASRGPNGGQPIRNRHNIPVVGWLILKGRCYDCKAPISVRYPIVEAGTAALFVGIVLKFEDEPRLWPAYLYLAAIGVALAFIDLDVHRLPDVIVLPSYAVLTALLLIDWHPYALLRALEGAAALFAFYYLIAVIAKGAMGFGDVKLAGVLGGAMAYLSWGTLLTGAFLAFILGSFVGVLLMAVGKAGRKTAIPFGPFMIVGAIAAVLGAGGIGDAYLRHLGVS